MPGSTLQERLVGYGGARRNVHSAVTHLGPFRTHRTATCPNNQPDLDPTKDDNKPSAYHIAVSGPYDTEDHESFNATRTALRYRRRKRTIYDIAY
jgi:hypothetical protein